MRRKTLLQGHDAGLVIKAIDSLSGLTAYLASKDLNAKDLPSLYGYSVQSDVNDSKYQCLNIIAPALRLGYAAEYTALTANGEKVKAAAGCQSVIHAPASADTARRHEHTLHVL